MAIPFDKHALAIGACIFTTLAATSVSHAAPGHRGGKSDAHAAKPYGKPGDPSDVRNFVFLNAKGMKFSKETIRIRRGQTVKFILRNKGDQDHEMTIGDAATQAAHRREMAEAQKKGKVGHHAHGHANAIYVKPGASKTLIWTFTKAGVFEFACNIPGHSEAGMKGKIVVTR